MGHNPLVSTCPYTYEITCHKIHRVGIIYHLSHFTCQYMPFLTIPSQPHIIKNACFIANFGYINKKETKIAQKKTNPISRFIIKWKAKFHLFKKKKHPHVPSQTSLCFFKIKIPKTTKVN